MSSAPKPDDIYAQFKKDVNMTAAELERWLKTEESKSVGQDSGDGSSIGHKSGERIGQLLRKKPADLIPDDDAHLRKVHSYVSRHSAQGSATDIEHSCWRHSLLNWGHDPLKKQ